MRQKVSESEFPWIQQRPMAIQLQIAWIVWTFQCACDPPFTNLFDALLHDGYGEWIFGIVRLKSRQNVSKPAFQFFRIEGHWNISGLERSFNAIRLPQRQIDAENRPVETPLLTEDISKL